MNLSDFFHRNPGGAVAFSGGVDSSYLVWAAAKYGNNWRAYYVHGPFQPAFELQDAQRVIEQCGLPLTVLEADVLSSPDVAKNPANRCYFCKQKIFGQIRTAAAADGYPSSLTAPTPLMTRKTVPGCRRFGNWRFVLPCGSAV